jgi:hypothetical protein
MLQGKIYRRKFVASPHDLFSLADKSGKSLFELFYNDKPRHGFAFQMGFLDLKRLQTTRLYSCTGYLQGKEQVHLVPTTVQQNQKINQ